ncbi:hypothetical protein OXX59_005796 [Metschnikowia pulcherrima]
MSLLSRVFHHSEKSPRPRSKSSSAFHQSNGQKKSLPPISLHINLESPPVVLYGHAHESTGSLISGVLTLEVNSQKPKSVALNTLTPQASASGLHPSTSASGLHPQASATSIGSEFSNGDGHLLSPCTSSDVSVEVESVILSLVQTVHYTKPFIVSSNSVSSCKRCATRKSVLASWDVLSQRASFPDGSHAYPFSHLLPGSIAASSKLGSAHSYSYIKYDLVAVAKCANKKVTVTLPVNVSRSILRGPDRNSLRVFPPTEVTASAVLPGVMYPKSTFPIELRMGHVVNSKQDRRWRMRKLSWKLEEHTQIAAYACEDHAHKIMSIEESQRKAQLAKMLRAGASPNHPPSGSNSGDGPSKSNGMHHSTIQTSMFVSPHPSNPQGAIQAAAMDAANLSEVPAGNHDIVEPEEEIPTNRVVDEVVHFEEDFGDATARANESPAQGQASPASSTGLSSIRSNGNDQPAESGNETGRTDEALFLDELRVVAHGDIKSGWKSDFSSDGSIELVAEISALECSSGIKRHKIKASSEETPPDETHEGLRNDANISCDINDPVLGIYVGHVLVIEVIVAEEIVQHSKHSHSGNNGLSPVTSTTSVTSTSNSVGVPTGAARVLRMQFKVVMTERSGLGIAWDDEVPPTYDDVRALSPPTYETSAIGTPNSALGISPGIGGQQMTPAVIYGLGDTPVVGSFVPNRNVNSIDAITDLDDSVQEFRL